MTADSQLEVKEWHFHVYWFARPGHPSAAEAAQFRERLLEKVKQDPTFVVVFNGVTSSIVPALTGTPPPMNHGPVGPHLSGSFEVWVPKESLAAALSWFTLHRGSLSVLIHPLTRYERRDHSTHAVWLGQPWTIDLEALSEDLEAKRQQSVSSMEEFWTFIAVVYGMMFVPIVGYFVYILVRDPAASEVVVLMGEWLKGKTVNFLSPKTENGIAPAAIEDLTAQLVRYMLYKACLKLPIKFSDISKDVFPKYKNVSRYLSSTTELDADLKKIKFLSFGPRTHLEIGKVQILNFVCKEPIPHVSFASALGDTLQDDLQISPLTKIIREQTARVQIRVSSIHATIGNKHFQIQLN
ncbi:hypothetical protein P43SY_006901 [Pythium insidiosum]|uniref:Uncharacterized protein n=1 Tax=Pythium insidiosum TaxID=114742 RepID=A0AAD5LHW7_PYTIN|nr:hypothetical protein P43SY_006901 [Pythium insidiosum]